MAPQRITATTLSRKVVSREEAQRRALPRFFDGTKCNFGHIWERYTGNNACAHPAHQRSQNTVRAKRRWDRLRQQRIAAGDTPRKRTSREGMTAEEWAEHEAQKYQANKARIIERARKRRQQAAAEREALIEKPPGYISRKDAIAQGLTRYFTGVPCPSGHVCERKVKGGCVICIRARIHAFNRPGGKGWVKTKARLYTNRKKTPLRRAGHNRRNARWRAGSLTNRLSNNLRRRLLMAIETNAKRGSAVRDLGCTIPEFKAYIAKQFRHGMCWEAWGTVWQLDHIRPLAAFHLTDRTQFLQACHFTNYQPLFLDEHRAKTQTEMRRRLDGRYASNRGNSTPAT